MSFDPSIKLVTVNFGPVLDFSGAVIADGSIIFRPSTSLVHIATGSMIFARDMKVRFGTDGTGLIQLPATDQDGFSDGNGNAVKNWTYTATWQFDDRSLTAPASITLQLPSAQDSVDLELLTRIPTQDGTTIALPTVVSVDGLTGAVRLDGKYTTQETLDGSINSMSQSLLARIDSKRNPLTYAGIKMADYPANPDELIHTDNSVVSFAVKLPLAADTALHSRIAVRNIALTRPNVTTIDANGSSFDIIGSSGIMKIERPGAGFEFEYIGNGVWAVTDISVPLAALQEDFEVAGAALDIRNQYGPLLDSLSKRPVPTARTLQHKHGGTISVGQLGRPGFFVEVGYTATVLRFKLFTPSAMPTGGTGAAGDFICDIYVTPPGGAATKVYTVDMAPGVTELVATDLNIVLPDGCWVTGTVTAVGDTANKPSDGVLILSEAAGSANVNTATVGAVVTVAAAPQSNNVTLTYAYVSGGLNASRLAIRYLEGTNPPGALIEGTIGPDLDPDSTRFTLAGLKSGTSYAISIIPVASDGTPGKPGTVLTTTTAPDTTAPDMATNFKVQGATSQSSVPLQWTWPTNPDLKGGYLRRRNNTTVAITTVTDGKPAGMGFSPTATEGLLILKDDGSTFTDTGLPADTPFVYALFTVDGAGNINPNPVSLTTRTQPAVTTGQGLGGNVPKEFSQDYVQDFSGDPTKILGVSNQTTDFNVFENYKNQEQGPTSGDSVSIIPEPGNTGNKVLSLTMRRRAGWYKPSDGRFDLGQADGATDGIGHYGARLELNGHRMVYGAFQFRVRTVNGVQNNCKGGCIMWYPITGWPQQELDLYELFKALEATINLHYDDGTKSPGTQITRRITNYDQNKWTTVLCIKDKPVGTAPARVRVWYQQDAVDLGAGVGAPALMIDTGIPGVVNPTPSTLTQTKINQLISPAKIMKVGMSLAYTNYWLKDANGNLVKDANGNPVKNATFTVPTGNGSAQRAAADVYVDNITLWTAPA